MSTPDLSIVLCTCNRVSLLDGALHAILAQQTPRARYEVIVVDNNSHDATPDVVAAAIRRAPLVRYLFEPEQGLSTARNAGVRAARAPLLVFTDDDVRVTPGWVDAIVDAFTRDRDAAWIGGKVLPIWLAPPPSWLSDAGWAPLAIADYGDESFDVTPDRPVCLIGANLSVRRTTFDRAGLFSTAVQRVGDGIGSTEDHEFHLRCWHAGLRGRYEPSVIAYAPIGAERLTPLYHRKWHAEHGRFHALMRDEGFERSSSGTLLGVPAHVYRATLAELASLAGDVASGRPTRAFRHELRLRFLIGFMRQRIFNGRRRHAY